MSKVQNVTIMPTNCTQGHLGSDDNNKCLTIKDQRWASGNRMQGTGVTVIVLNIYGV